MPGKIAVGQLWRNRGGNVVRVTCDREAFALVPRWRWSLSDSHLVDDDGRTVGDAPSPHDLVELVSDVDQQADWIRQDESIRGMDSQRDQL